MQCAIETAMELGYSSMKPEQVEGTVALIIDNRVGDWQQSRDPFRTRGPSEVVVFTPQKVSQGVDFQESITERFMMLCEGSC